jgi:hypothetical protein
MTQEEKRILINWCKKKKKEFDWFPLTMRTIISGNPNKGKIELLDEFVEKISEL